MSEAGFRWTQDEWGDEAGGRRASTRSERLAWFVVIALAILAFELTADAAISTAVGCLKFGWEDFRVARWLKRTDPDRRRGRICGWFYRACGLCRISVVATVLMFVIVFVLGPPGKQGRPAGNAPVVWEPPREFAVAGIVVMAGLLLSASTSSLAVVSALRHRVKVWVGPEPRWAREEGVWPPSLARRRRETRNRAEVILFAATLTGVGIGLAVVAILAFGGPAQNQSAIPLMVAMLAVLVIVPVSVLLLMEHFRRRVIADSPADCWGKSPLSRDE